ncbi:MAG TPA: type I glyceraldehyde-3-phosphate dehydrogenase [Candidatus Bathyarchaeia archaeon]|nr:type I glyceraldehyde-3-phosphate dehydrogenase [Candidatus Bathyarchaeia archaeon]
MVRIAVNGFGRIGRIVTRAALIHYPGELKIVAINTSGSMETAGWGHLLKYDSVYGRFEKEVNWDKDDLIIEEERYPVLAERDPAKIPWGRFGVDVVIESTGVFRDLESAGKHLDSGAKRVIISAPPKDGKIPIFIKGVNLNKYQEEKVISCGSCTTNCVAPICKVVLKNFEIEDGRMTTIHAVTADQQLVDGSHKDLRRARAAMVNIIPTTSGAAEAVVEVLPKLRQKFTATAIRVPVICGSYSDLTFKLKKRTTAKEINKVLKKASEKEMSGIISFSQEPLVSSDVLKDTHSAIVDGAMTQVVSQDLVQIGAWYDNEWAYSCRLIEEAIYIGRHAA